MFSNAHSFSWTFLWVEKEQNLSKIIWKSDISWRAVSNRNAKYSNCYCNSTFVFIRIWFSTSLFSLILTPPSFIRPWTCSLMLYFCNLFLKLGWENVLIILCQRGSFELWRAIPIEFSTKWVPTPSVRTYSETYTFIHGLDSLQSLQLVGTHVTLLLNNWFSLIMLYSFFASCPIIDWLFQKKITMIEYCYYWIAIHQNLLSKQCQSCIFFFFLNRCCTDSAKYQSLIAN